MSNVPSPLSINPTQAWDGNDGPWSTFFLGIGTPPQYARMLISLTVVQPWLVLPEGCTPTDPADCPSKRGSLFHTNESTTWQDQGLYTLEFEKNLGFDDNGDFSYDTVVLGLPGTGAPSLKKQVVAGIAAKDFYVGLWGLGPRPTNLTSLNNPYPSLMTNLKENKLVPSISYGYTAGARYRLKQVAGSLTLGGYDASRFAPGNVSFSFAGDVSRDLVVGIQSITVDGLNASNPASPNLLPSPILSFIDAGVSQIWLPLEACNMFESAFGLQYDPVTELYLVNETAHAALVAQNSSITFTIATDISGSNRVPIVFPYAAFDLQLTADYPGINETTRYFPIRRAANATQYTLGRTFLQEVYIVADYERFNFTVNQCVFSESVPEDIQTIFPTLSNASSTPRPTSSSSPSAPSHSNARSIIIGSAIAAVFVILALSVIVLVIRRRRKVETQRRNDPLKQQDMLPEMGLGREKPGELHGEVRRPPELEDKSRQELQGCAGGHELEQTRSSTYEPREHASAQEMEGELGPPFELATNDVEGRQRLDKRINAGDAE